MIQKKDSNPFNWEAVLFVDPLPFCIFKYFLIKSILVSSPHVKPNHNMACAASLAICYPRLVYQQSVYVLCVCLSAVGDGRCWVSLAVNVYKTWVGLKVERKGQSAVSLFGFFPPLHFYFVSNLPLHHHQRRANVPVSERACHFSPITLAQMSLFNNLARGC